MNDKTPTITIKNYIMKTHYCKCYKRKLSEGHIFFLLPRFEIIFFLNKIFNNIQHRVNKNKVVGNM